MTFCFTPRLPVLLSSGMLLSASLLAIAQDVPSAATRGASTLVLTGTTLTAVESMDGPSYVGGYAFFGGQMTVTKIGAEVQLGSPLKVFSNTGTGTFVTRNTGLPTNGTIQIPDLNGDVFPDYVVQSATALQVFLGQPDGSISSTEVLVSTSGITLDKITSMPLVGNFVGDGAKDLLVVTTNGASSPSTRISVLAGRLNGGVFDFNPLTSVAARGGAIIDTSGLPQRLPVIAQTTHWTGAAAQDVVFASSSFDGVYASVQITVNSTPLVAPTSVTGPALRIVSITTGDIDGDGLDEIAVIYSPSQTDLTGAKTSLYKGGDSAKNNILNSSILIVSDVTGDGVADIVGTLSSTVGLFPGRTGFMSGLAGSIIDSYTTLTPSHTFADAVIGSATALYRAQAVPLLTPDIGSDPKAQQLLLGDYATVLTGSAVLQPKVIPALQPSFTGVTTTPKVVTLPKQPTPVVDAAFQMAFGDTSSVVNQLIVTLSSQNFPASDSLSFTPGSSLGAPAVSPILPNPVTGLYDITYTFSPQTAVTVASCTGLLQTMRFSTQEAQTFGDRLISVTTKATFTPADPAAFYASTVKVATINATFNTADLGSVKAGGSLSSQLAYGTNNLAARGIPYGSSNFQVTTQPTRGTATITGDINNGYFLTYTANLLTGGPTTDQVVVTYTPGNAGAARGLLGGTESITFFVTNAQDPLGAVAADLAAVPGLGRPFHVRVYNGHAPYTVTARGGTLRMGSLFGATQNGLDLNLDSSNDLYQDVFITPTVPFDNTFNDGSASTVAVDVVDADGTPTTFLLNNVPILPSVTVAAPQIPVSVGGETLFGAICPSTLSGVSSLHTALLGKDKTTVRAFAWDAAVQNYVELPEVEPTGGVQPTTGVFLATRANLGLDFSGVPSVMGAVIELHPGWNFVGLGPIDNGGTIETAHPFIKFNIVDDLGSQLTQASISAQPYYWDGAAYTPVSTMTAGVSYWINNHTATNVQLVRQTTAAFSARAVRSSADETPPAPPATNSATSVHNEGHHCGAGSGIALVLGGLLALARFARFRR